MPRNGLVRNLINREMYGSFSMRHSRASQRPSAMKPLVPKSCFTFRLQDLIPKSALLKGHIVLGFSRCGQFLLTYTCGSFEASMGFTNRYILHWWACIPRGKAKRVAEVTLFKDQGVDENLLLVLCQWPNDNTKMLIYGVSEPHMTITTQAQPFYLTVTMVPSLHNCQDCQRVAATFEVEDLVANWDSCVRLSCLRHSATVHTSVDIVAPFPQFEPEVSLKLDGTVVINTGNFLHVLRVELESSVRGTEQDTDPLLHPCRVEPEEEELLSSLMLQNCELTYPQVRSSGPHASPIMFLKSPQYFSSEEETEPLEKRPKFDSESEDSIIDSPIMNTRKEKLFFVDSEPTPKPKQLKQMAEAEKVFEFIDENPPDIKLSAFRLRRLADKKYEFCVDEDESENIVPYRRQESPVKKHEGSPQPTTANSQSQQSQRRLPQQTNMQELSIYTSPPFSPSGEVLRPLNSNSLAASQQLGSPVPQQTEEHKSSPRPCSHLSELASPGGRCRNTVEPRKPFTYLVKLQRRYFEVDDEIISVITDVEDDELGALTGYHSALPLEVHGSGYAQMQMVSNNKAGKLRASCVLVQQTSFDIEQFCHEVAQLMCAEAGIKYWFCNDYDVEIFDVCPNSGDVIVVAFILLQATSKSKAINKNPRLMLSGLQRRTYQGSFMFTWNLETGRYWVLSTSLLREQEPLPLSSTLWHPARAERSSLRRQAPPLPTHPPVRCLSNKSVLKGVSLASLLDLENHMRIILQ